MWTNHFQIDDSQFCRKLHMCILLCEYMVWARSTRTRVSSQMTLVWMCPYKAHVLECQLPLQQCGGVVGLLTAAVAMDHEPNRWTDLRMTELSQDRLLYKQILLPKSPLALSMLGLSLKVLTKCWPHALGLCSLQTISHEGLCNSPSLWYSIIAAGYKRRQGSIGSGGEFIGLHRLTLCATSCLHLWLCLCWWAWLFLLPHS